MNISAPPVIPLLNQGGLTTLIVAALITLGAALLFRVRNVLTKFLAVLLALAALTLFYQVFPAIGPFLYGASIILVGFMAIAMFLQRDKKSGISATDILAVVLLIVSVLAGYSYGSSLSADIQLNGSLAEALKSGWDQLVQVWRGATDGYQKVNQ